MSVENFHADDDLREMVKNGEIVNLTTGIIYDQTVAEFMDWYGYVQACFSRMHAINDVLGPQKFSTRSKLWRKNLGYLEIALANCKTVKDSYVTGETV